MLDFIGYGDQHEKIKRHHNISTYQAENREAQLAAMRKGRANLPKLVDTKPEYRQRSNRYYGTKAMRILNPKGRRLFLLPLSNML